MILKQQQLVEDIPAPRLFDQLMGLAQPYEGIPYQWDGHGNPGFDCSEFVRYVYQELFGIDLPGFTDSIFTSRALMGTIWPMLGDIVEYEYRDAGQPGVRFPHVGIWLNNDYVLDSRWPDGVGIHRHLDTKKFYLTERKETK